MSWSEDAQGSGERAIKWQISMHTVAQKISLIAKSFCRAVAGCTGARLALASWWRLAHHSEALPLATDPPNENAA